MCRRIVWTLWYCPRSNALRSATIPPAGPNWSSSCAAPRSRRTAQQRASTLGRKNDTEQHSFIQAFLPRSADMRTTVWRDHVVDLVIWNRRPLAVYFDFVMVADHTALSRSTVHEVTAGAFAVISVQLRVEALMPFIVACPGISLLRRAAHTKRHGERSAE